MQNLPFIAMDVDVDLDHIPKALRHYSHQPPESNRADEVFGEVGQIAELVWTVEHCCELRHPAS